MSEVDIDNNHPIPGVNAVDVVGKLIGGGADLLIVCRGPLEPDLRTQQRLLTKIGNYQNWCLSTEFEVEFGVGPRTIKVCLAGEPHEVIEWCLNEWRPLVEDNGVALLWQVGVDG